MSLKEHLVFTENLESIQKFIGDGVFLPDIIRKDKTLSWNEKALLAVLLQNDSEEGCKISNKEASIILQLSNGRTCRILNDLRKNGWIDRVKFDGRDTWWKVVKWIPNYKSKPYIPKQVKLGYGIEFDNKLKKKIKERDSNNCQNPKCKDPSKKPLHVHHIDYDKTNNKENNLITLCMCCHGKTMGKRNKWKRFYEKLMTERFPKYQQHSKSGESVL